MTAFKFPNKSDEYRYRRDALLDKEVGLREEIETVAGLRRQLIEVPRHAVVTPDVWDVLPFPGSTS